MNQEGKNKNTSPFKSEKEREDFKYRNKGSWLFEKHFKNLLKDPSLYNKSEAEVEKEIGDNLVDGVDKEEAFKKYRSVKTLRDSIKKEASMLKNKMKFNKSKIEAEGLEEEKKILAQKEKEFNKRQSEIALENLKNLTTEEFLTNRRPQVQNIAGFEADFYKDKPDFSDESNNKQEKIDVNQIKVNTLPDILKNISKEDIKENHLKYGIHTSNPIYEKLLNDGTLGKPFTLGQIVQIIKDQSILDKNNNFPDGILEKDYKFNNFLVKIDENKNMIVNITGGHYRSANPEIYSDLNISWILYGELGETNISENTRILSLKD